jgi:3-phosphoshikimate 1-carboxyvinyltransferase
MTASHEIGPAASIRGAVRVPGSKSLTLRALFVGGLARGSTVLRGALRSGDVKRMTAGLRALGAEVDPAREDGSLAIVGVDGSPKRGPSAIDVGDCGTCMRLLLGAACLGEGIRTLDGTPRMRERPVGGLGRALARLGAGIEYPGNEGYPPVRVRARGLRGGDVEVDASASSQYLSALLLVAPFASGDLRIRAGETLPSRPYVDLSLEVMEAFGAEASREESGLWRVRAGRTYGGREFEVEGDWSSASYFLAAAAVCEGEVEIVGVRRTSRQGDAVFVGFLEALGCRARDTERGILLEGGPLRGELRLDLRDAPDIVPTAAVVAAFNRGRVEITGVPHLRLKESDRIRTVAEALRRIGVRVEERDDGLTVDGGATLHGARIDPRGDHRIAMSLAIAGLRVPGVSILDPGCVAKSYPSFFDDLGRIVEPRS